MGSFSERVYSSAVAAPSEQGEDRILHGTRKIAEIAAACSEIASAILAMPVGLLLVGTLAYSRPAIRSVLPARRCASPVLCTPRIDTAAIQPLGLSPPLPPLAPGYVALEVVSVNATMSGTVEEFTGAVAASYKASLAATTEKLVEIARKHGCTSVVGLDFGGDGGPIMPSRTPDE